MTFSVPWSLLGLAAVAAAAAWALLRPGRRLAVVASVRLWQEAIQSMDRSHRRRSRRVTASWLVLLLGATLAVLAAAGPVYHAQRPGRRVALVICPSAELAGEGVKHLRAEASTLLGRLDDDDRVTLVLPAILGGRQPPVSPRRAADRLAYLAALPAERDETAIPPVEQAVQRTYELVPAGSPDPARPGVTRIEIPHPVAPAAIDAIGAVQLPGTGRMEVFLAATNRTAAAWHGRLVVTVRDVDRDDKRTFMDRPIRLAAGARGQWLQRGPSAQMVSAQLLADGKPLGSVAAAAFLVRRSAQRRKITLTGADEPLLRRYVQADESLVSVARPAEADIVVTNGESAPAGKAALVIRPPSPPAGWRWAKTAESAVLADAQVAVDHDVMRHVDLAGVQVRRLAGWESVGLSDLEVLVGRGGAALVLAGSSGGVRRVYVTFDLAAENTNFALRQDFVVFLANVMRYLAPPGRPRAEFRHVRPTRAPPAGGRDWKRLLGPDPDPFAGPDGPLFAPGIYRDAAGQLHAVSLVGLAPAPPDRPRGPTADDVELPQPQPVGRQVALWPYLVAAAMAAWVIGWLLRVA